MELICFVVGIAVITFGGLILLMFMLEFAANQVVRIAKCYHLLFDFAWHREEFKKWLKDKEV